MRSNKHVVQKCAACGKDFTLSTYQRYSFNAGKKVFVCSTSCRGAYGFSVYRKKANIPFRDAYGRAHGEVRKAVKNGNLLKPEKCEACRQKPKGVGAGGLHAHHFKGYEHPLEVQWLCPPCHKIADTSKLARGERGGRTKLTARRVVLVRQLLEEGCAITRVAKVFEVDKKAIAQIRDRRTWRHI